MMIVSGCSGDGEGEERSNPHTHKTWECGVGVRLLQCRYLSYCAVAAGNISFLPAPFPNSGVGNFVRLCAGFLVWWGS